MSNTHEVFIEGEMPFNVYEHDAATRWLGIMNAPCWGLRISYGSSRYVPNPDGGQTAMYKFIISGREAIWASGLVKMLNALRFAGATITQAKAKDLDYPTDWFNLTELMVVPGEREVIKDDR